MLSDLVAISVTTDDIRRTRRPSYREQGGKQGAPLDLLIVVVLLLLVVLVSSMHSTCTTHIYMHIIVRVLNLVLHVVLRPQ